MKRILKACVEGFILVLLMYLFLVVFETQINFSKYGIDVMGVWTNAYFPLFILISGFSYIHSFSLVNIDHEFVRVQKEEVYNRLSDSEKKLADSMDFIEREAFLYKRIQEVLENEGEDAFKNIKENFEKDSKEWNHKLKITRLFCDLFIAVGLVFVLSSPVQAIVNFYEAFEERRIYLQETVVDQTLYLEGYPPIVLMGDGQFTNGDVEYIVNEILPSQPKGLIVLPSSIVFMNDDVWAQQGNEDCYCGFAYSCDYSIEVRLNYYSDKETVTHECAHILDFIYGYSSDPTMLAFYEENPEIVREYGGTNPDEFFAVGSEAYFWNQGNIDQNSPYFQYLKGVFAPFE